ncbi:MAG: hypothetical protein KDD35_07665, partial [Bdellovibrionales bacterium]|nr:hypothetical protein [Bdellovibrionales bacterium]
MALLSMWVLDRALPKSFSKTDETEVSRGRYQRAKRKAVEKLSQEMLKIQMKNLNENESSGQAYGGGVGSWKEFKEGEFENREHSKRQDSVNGDDRINRKNKNSSPEEIEFQKQVAGSRKASSAESGDFQEGSLESKGDGGGKGDGEG